MKPNALLHHPLAEYFAQMAVDLKNVRRLEMGLNGLRVTTEIRRTIAEQTNMARPSCRIGMRVCVARHIAQRERFRWFTLEDHINAAAAKQFVEKFFGEGGAN